MTTSLKWKHRCSQYFCYTFYMNKIKLIATATIILSILNIYVIFAKIQPFQPCSCAASTYLPYPLFLKFLENPATMYIICDPVGGCESGFWIFPIDTIMLNLIFAGIYLYLRKKEAY